MPRLTHGTLHVVYTGYLGFHLWSSVTYDVKQLWHVGRTTTSLLDTNERSTQPDNKERVDDDQEADEDDANADDGDFSDGQRQHAASTVVGWMTSFITDTDVVCKVAVTDLVHLMALRRQGTRATHHTCVEQCTRPIRYEITCTQTLARSHRSRNQPE